MKAAIVVDSSRLEVETDSGLLIQIRGMPREALEFLADRLNSYDKGNIAIAALQRMHADHLAIGTLNQDYITTREALKEMGLL